MQIFRLSGSILDATQQKEGKEFIVTIDGIEGRGKTTAEAMSLTKELKALFASE